MSGKHHKSKRRRTQQTTEEFVSSNVNEDDSIANLNQLIVKNNETSYDPKYMDMGGKRQSNTLMNNSSAVEQGNLFRNCAMAIANQTSINPATPISETIMNSTQETNIVIPDYAPPIPSKQKRPSPQSDINPNMSRRQQIENPIEKPAYNNMDEEASSDYQYTEQQVYKQQTKDICKKKDYSP